MKQWWMGVLVLFGLTLIGVQAQETDSSRAQIEDVPGLPRVFIIGDSISLGYTADVRELLHGKANVHRPNANCGGTSQALRVSEDGERAIDRWLGDGKFDLIHFNWGLWDINRRVGGKRNTDGPVAATEEQYAERLEILVQRLKETGAILVWAPTTFVQGGWGRIAGDEIRYNEIAKEIMDRHGILIDDLHALSATFPLYGEGPEGEPELFKSKGNVHFSEAGSRRLAEQIAAFIEETLEQRKQ